MSKKRPLLAPPARSRLLISRLFKSPDAVLVVEKIVRDSREEGQHRDVYKARLIPILVEVKQGIEESPNGKKLGITFNEDDLLKAAGRLLRLGYQLDGPNSHLRPVV